MGNHRILTALIGAPLALPAELLELFPELAAARFRSGGLPVHLGGWCLGQRTVAGITLWRTVWLASHAPPDPWLLLHELRHVHQFGASPFFPVLYILESLRRGYRGNRYETDANAYAARRLREAALPLPSTPA